MAFKKKGSFSTCCNTCKTSSLVARFSENALALPAAIPISVETLSIRRNPQIIPAVHLHSHNLPLPAKLRPRYLTRTAIQNPHALPPGRQYPIMLTPRRHIIKKSIRPLLPPDRNRIHDTPRIIPTIYHTPPSQKKSIVRQHVRMSLQSSLAPPNPFEIITFPLIHTYPFRRRNPDIILGILYNKMNQIIRQRSSRIWHCRIILELMAIKTAHPPTRTNPKKAIMVEHDRTHKILRKPILLRQLLEIKIRRRLNDEGQAGHNADPQKQQICKQVFSHTKTKIRKCFH